MNMGICIFYIIFFFWNKFGYYYIKGKKYWLKLSFTKIYLISFQITHCLCKIKLKEEKRKIKAKSKNEEDCGDFDCSIVLFESSSCSEWVHLFRDSGVHKQNRLSNKEMW